MTGRSAVAAALFALSLSAVPAGAAVEVARARMLMGTVLSARVEAASDSAGARALAAALDEVARLEAVMSSWRADSEVARLNASGTVPFALSPDLAAVLDSSLALAAATGGAFDPTVEPLSAAWDLRGPGRVPDDTTLAGAVARTGWSGLTLDRTAGTARFARERMGVDLGGIGKGYALDRMVALLEARGVTRGWLDFGGQVRWLADGDLPAGSGGPAPISIAHPEDRERVCVLMAPVRGSVSTSAQSERAFEHGGKRYGHVIDPRTGVPVPGRASVTVTAASGTRADALSTALLVMGRDAAARYAAAHRDVGVLWLEPEGKAVHAWCWNLFSVAAVPGAHVRWKTPDPASGHPPRKKGNP